MQQSHFQYAFYQRASDWVLGQKLVFCNNHNGDGFVFLFLCFVVFLVFFGRLGGWGGGLWG